MSEHIAVLGGGTPYSAALADALADRGDTMAPGDLVLVGRRPDTLECVGRYVRLRLAPFGWRTSWTTDSRAALRGAGIVLHQIRYGGTAGRKRDEELALACGCAADETLGPGALQSALRLRASLSETCRVLANECPEAVVLNLTNPLSLTTALMIEAGVAACVGLCELPRVTMEAAAAVLGRDPAQAHWAYAGLNHRGFIVRLEWDGCDHRRELIGRLDGKTLNGIGADEIASLDAIPTTYHCLLRGNAPAQGRGRASFLETLRTRILQEICADPTRSPPSLKERYMAWYPRAVVPALAALRSTSPVMCEVNALAASGLVEEGRAHLGRAGAGPLLQGDAPAPVAGWNERHRRHERRLLCTLAQPSLPAIRRALEADPLVPSHCIEDCARRVWERIPHEAVAA